jgi:hypothetical protein
MLLVVVEHPGRQADRRETGGGIAVHRAAIRALFLGDRRPDAAASTRLNSAAERYWAGDV